MAVLEMFFWEHQLATKQDKTVDKYCRGKFSEHIWGKEGESVGASRFFRLEICKGVMAGRQPANLSASWPFSVVWSCISSNVASRHGQRPRWRSFLSDISLCVLTFCCPERVISVGVGGKLAVWDFRWFPEDVLFLLTAKCCTHTDINRKRVIHPF